MNDRINKYSEPIQEIIGTAPSWITRFGISIILGILLVIFALGYAIMLPQTMSASIVILCETDSSTNDKTTVSGFLEIPSHSIGRIAAGQQVTIKLHPFPYLEYGTIKGVVTDDAPVPIRLGGEGLHYQVGVSLPDGLNHYDDYSLAMLPEMDGTAEIITGEVRLIRYLINPANPLVNK